MISSRIYRLVYTYAWEERGDRGPDTLVTLSFAEVAPFRTKLTIHQRPFRTREERDGYREAWEQTLDRFGPASMMPKAGCRLPAFDWRPSKPEA